MHSSLLASIVALATLDNTHAESIQTVSFLVTYDPATLMCRTCTDSIGGSHPTGDCLQLTAGCPNPFTQENNEGACIGGFCGTDDDAGIGGDLTIQPPPPSPNPTTVPTAAPSAAPTTRAPTAPADTFSPTESTTLSPTPSPTTPAPTVAAPPPPPVCNVASTCNCENVRLAPAENRSVIDITCIGGGFVAGNSTTNQTLDGIVVGDCSLSYNETFEYTDVNGVVVSEDIFICYTEGQAVVPEEEEECTSNTGVIIIIVICVLLLLAVIGIGVYYIVHTTNAHADGPKFTSGSPHTM